MNYKNKIKEKLKLLPLKPGCYLMKDKNNTVIYVGKAKKLKNRVTSYFVRKKTGKTKMLVENIYDFEYIVSGSEKEALLLEYNLIKKYDPKYNIIFKDDKSYPYICLEYDKFPKLSVVRPNKNFKKKNVKYFGPYPNSIAARKIVQILNRIYPLQKCKNFKDKLCLYYYIGECLGYCNLKIEKSITDNIVKEITTFLNGNYNNVINKLNERMLKYSNNMEYEKAKEIKELIEYIKVVLEKQKIDLKDNIDRDIFNYYVYKDYISIQVMHSRSGNLVERKSYIYELNEDEIEVMNNFIISFYEKSISNPKEIFVPEQLDNKLLEECLKIKVLVPKIGTKKKLLEMAKENAKIQIKEKIELIKRDYNRTVHANEELGKLLNIDIHRIESFDNSHLFGNYKVAGMVVFVNGKKSTKDYRKFKIISEAKDDYHMMMEIIERRYSRVINEDLIKPDLILVDGGLIQINACKEVLDNLGLEIRVCGMQKNDKHRITSLIDENNNIINIEKNSDLFHYLETISEEVHRFAISFHKEIRSKGNLSSLLDEVPLIGNKRKKELLKKFKSLDGIKNASDEELLKIIPKNALDNLKRIISS